MQVILLEKIDKLGSLGDLVDVKAGFARNFLLPQKKAEVASASNIEAFAARRAELEKQQAEALQAAQSRADKLGGLTVSITSRSGTEGKLFGSVGTEEIRSAIAAAGVEVEKKEIRLPDGPLRTVGEHPWDSACATDKVAQTRSIAVRLNKWLLPPTTLLLILNQQVSWLNSLVRRACRRTRSKPSKPSSVVC